MTLVSFPGERGAYSEAAAKSFFNEKIETVPLATFAEILEYASTDKVQYAILPVENSLEGSVGESYDLLYSTPLYAIGEIYYKVEHCLIGKGKISEIDTVYSHPQALGQCKQFIEKYGMKPIPVYDTAGSVKIVKELNKINCASIASKRAAEINQMPIIAEDIANDKNNHTRFLIMAKTESAQTENDKTSVIFSIKHEPGALYRVIKNFHVNNVNLTKIESRPTKSNTWEYNFYVDFEGHKDDSKIAGMLKEIKRDALFMKVLGSYPSAKLR